ncbi:uncharacterized protein LOC131014278 [Salvia miltiorrhiza]|uniref:uncharacterized protein LOC131014278 n=1 Tax=Salvia miltiorrhiza TaxID=226208 RepID=UPI0025AD58D2|nr:uncharacterized protein LOC131014278 [Salvia miltiorrhiza]
MGTGEILYEYWGRFKQMLAKCPQHQIPDHDLIRYFVGGLRRQDRQWLHVACGGSILNKSTVEAFKLIADMAEESRDEKGTIVRTTPVLAPSAQDKKLDKLCNMFKKFMTNQGTPNQGIPNIRKPVKPGGNNGGQNQKPFEPYRQQYNNQGWRQHENLRYGNNNFLGQNQGQTSIPPQYSQQPQQGRGSSLSEFVHQMAQQQMKFQQETEKFIMETRGGMQNVNSQLSHLAQAVARLERKQGTLSSQVEVKKVNAMTLRGGKELPEVDKEKNKEKPEINEQVGMGSADEEEFAQEREAKRKATGKGKEKSSQTEPRLPFPDKMAK